MTFSNGFQTCLYVNQTGSQQIMNSDMSHKKIVNDESSLPNDGKGITIVQPWILMGYSGCMRILTMATKCMRTKRPLWLQQLLHIQ